MEKFHKVCKRMVVWKIDLLLWWRLLYFVAFFASTFVFKFDWKHWEMLLKIPWFNLISWFGNSVGTMRYEKVSTPGKQVKLQYFSQCGLLNVQRSIFSKICQTYWLLWRLSAYQKSKWWTQKACWKWLSQNQIFPSKNMQGM